MNWRELAACDTDEGRRIMFDAIDCPDNDAVIDAAVAICKFDCPVADECLEANLDMQFGVVGGLDEKERDAIRRGKPIPRNRRYCNAGHKRTRANTKIHYWGGHRRYTCLECKTERKQREEAA